MLPSIILLCASCLSWKLVLLVHSSLNTHPSVLFMRVSMCKSWEPQRPTASYQTWSWLWLVTGQSCSPGGATCGRMNRGANQQTELYSNRVRKVGPFQLRKVFSLLLYCQMLLRFHQLQICPLCWLVLSRHSFAGIWGMNGHFQVSDKCI